MPLTWVTLGLWQALVPLSWPCATKAIMDRELAFRQLRHLALAAGADAVIAELKTGGTDGILVAWGWLLRRKPAETPVP